MSKRSIDLHIHSTASDGLLSPTEVVKRALACGVSTLALTDHDTVAGLAEAQQAADSLGIRLIPGIELSCVWNGMTLHVLGLNIRPDALSMQAAEEVQRDNRIRRAQVIADKLAKLKLGSVWEGVTRIAQGRVPSRPDFANYLLEQGMVDSVQQAFERYLGAGKVGDVKQFWPHLEEIVSWIRGAEGVAVIAHPARYKMTTAKLRRLLQEFKTLGGEALEVSTPNLDSGRIGLMSELCAQYQLAGSCGSDFHVTGRPWQDIGHFPPMPASVRPVWDLWGEKVYA